MIPIARASIGEEELREEEKVLRSGLILNEHLK